MRERRFADAHPAGGRDAEMQPCRSAFEPGAALRDSAPYRSRLRERRFSAALRYAGGYTARRLRDVRRSAEALCFELPQDAPRSAADGCTAVRRLHADPRWECMLFPAFSARGAEQAMCTDRHIAAQNRDRYMQTHRFVRSVRPCPRCGACATLPMWEGLERVIRNYLDGITLQDLLEQQTARAANDYVI